MTAWYIDVHIHIFKKQKQKRIPWDSTWTGLCCLNGEQGCFSLILPRSIPGRCVVSSSLSSMVELGASAQTPKLNFLENINLGPKFWIWSSNVDVQFYLVLCRWFLFLSGTSKSSTIIMFIIVMFIFMFLFQQTQSRGNSYSVKSSDIILCTSFIKLKYVSVLWMSLSLVYHLIALLSVPIYQVGIYLPALSLYCFPSLFFLPSPTLSLHLGIGPTKDIHPMRQRFETCTVKRLGEKHWVWQVLFQLLLRLRASMNTRKDTNQCGGVRM